MTDEQPLQLFLRHALLVVRLSTTLGEVRARALPGQIVVIASSDGQPMFVVAEETLRRLNAAADTPLGELSAEFDVAVITAPGTSPRELAVGMLYDPAIRWHVVMVEGEILAVVPPHTLIEAFARQRIAEESPPLFKSQGRPLIDLLIRDGLFGGPPQVSPPARLCYRCTQDASHSYAPTQITQRDLLGRALCPDDGALMVALNPC